MALFLNPAVADAYESKTLAEMRGLVFGSLGFVDPLTFGPPRSLKMLRDSLLAQMGFIGALNVIQTPGPGGSTYPPTRTLKNLRLSITNRLGLALALGAPATSGTSNDFQTIYDAVYANMGYSSQLTAPPGVQTLINGWMNQALQALYARIEMDKGSGGVTTNVMPPKWTVGNCPLDGNVVRMLATALGKAHDGSPDASAWNAQAERYLADITQRTPPNIVGLVNATIIGAHRSVLRRFEMGNVSDPLAGPSMSDFGVDITASGDYRDILCDDDQCETDDNAVELLALAQLKEKVGQPDAKTAMAQYEQYMVDQEKRGGNEEIMAANAALTSANETIFRRYVVGNFGTTNHSQNWQIGTSFTFKFDDDLPQVDDQAVYLLALANLEQRYKRDTWKQSRMDYERYMDDLFLRMPPNATPLVNSILKQVQQQLFRQYAIFRDKYWFTWTMKAGQRFYGAFDHDNARSLAPINVKAVQGAPASDHTMAGKRQDCQVIKMPDGRVFVIGGSDQSGNILKSTQIYDPATGSWGPGPDMNLARTEFTATLTQLSDGTPWLVVSGGWNGSVVALGEYYSPVDHTFHMTDDLTYGRKEHTATRLHDDTILICGGTKTAVVSGEEYQAEIYDPTSGAYSAPPTAEMIKKRMGHTATLLPDGRVLLTGGLIMGSFENASNTTEIYNPATKTFTPGPPMKFARRYHTATLLATGQVLVAGGWDESDAPQATAELFDPFNVKFNNTASLMTVARGLHMAILMVNGKVLLAGAALDPDGSTGEVYDPATKKFTAVANTMQLSIAQTQMVNLDDGRVIIPGGATTTSATNLVSFFDPVTELFSASGSMTAGDSSYVVTAITANGESEPSIPALIFDVQPQHAINVSWTILPNQPYVTGFNVYRGKTTGTERFIGTVGPTVNTFIDNGDIAPGALAPTQNDTQGPGALDVRKIEWVGISQDNVSWRPLVIGVPPTTYNNNQEGIPQFCEIRQAIELWPTPAMDGWKLRIKGSFAPFLFENDNDYTTLDWQAIWFFAVAAAKSTFKRIDGRPMFNQIDIATAGAQADEYLGNLIAGSHMGQRFIPGEPVRRNEIQPILLPGPNS